MKTPYYAVIFTSQLTNHTEGYIEMAELMELVAKQQPGYLGLEAARNEIGITVSYWKSTEAILKWKSQVDHLGAQKLGRAQWYAWYKIRICKVEREYEFLKKDI
ncbi:antibiotic biosynthesis monooxygenase family protein [Cochleicola gelatinilyticus]|uniref:JEMB protein n=1 Tax=Cochleicola gelatinilyticus TaxID=1763537 RepID=A0A167J4J6_9FLAO|nr:antibiotic biosynthesis monooxygenase [Cochleicola gelatinilyticus]OAB80333.1 JEMB protein [Cochleicola gelatinilyticus]